GHGVFRAPPGRTKNVRNYARELASSLFRWWRHLFQVSRSKIHPRLDSSMNAPSDHPSSAAVNSPASGERASSPPELPSVRQVMGEHEIPPDEPSVTEKVKTLLVGKPFNLADRRVYQHISLAAFLAWVGLGADGLSSSCYGPAEAF